MLRLYLPLLSSALVGPIALSLWYLDSRPQLILALPSLAVNLLANVSRGRVHAAAVPNGISVPDLDLPVRDIQFDDPACIRR
jgi:hypothetical protein